MKKYLFKILLCFISCSPAFGQNGFYQQLADSALVLTSQQVQYDPSYYRMEYPNGDVPEGRGVCTDVIIRAYRKLGIDLQKEVHEDMKVHFDQYPNNWGLSRPDKNIDHRRVPNLMTFFNRHGTVKAITKNPKDYQAGRYCVLEFRGRPNPYWHCIYTKIKRWDEKPHHPQHRCRAGDRRCFIRI